MNQLPSVFKLIIPYSVIGNGAVENVGTVIRQLGGKKVLIVTDPGIVQAGLLDKVKQPLSKEGIEFGIFDTCKPNAPFSDVRKCAQVAKDGGYDLLVGIGGGSVMDLTKMASLVAAAKDVAHENINKYIKEVKGIRGLLKLLIPTTAGTGSEWTFYAAMVDDEGDGEKKGGWYPALLAQAVIVDPLLTLNLPRKVTADTGADALCHAVEGYTSDMTENVIGEMFQKTAIKLIANNLRTACGKGSNQEARYNMSVASMMATMAMSFTGITLAHGLAGSFQMKANCTHGTACALILPYVLEYNMITTMPKLACLAELMGEHVAGLSQLDAAKKAVESIRKLFSDVGLPQRLRDFGVNKEDFPHIIDLLFKFEHTCVIRNPRDCTREDVAGILEAAW